MQNEYLKSFNQLNQDALDSARKLGEINLRAGERLFQQQLDLANAWVNTAARGWELLGQADGYQELVSGQARLAQEYAQEVQKAFRGGAEILADVRQSAGRVLDEGLQAAGERVRQAGDKAAA